MKRDSKCNSGSILVLVASWVFVLVRSRPRFYYSLKAFVAELATVGRESLSYDFPIIGILIGDINDFDASIGTGQIDSRILLPYPVQFGGDEIAVIAIPPFILPK